MDTTGPFLRVATLATLFTVCCGKLATEPAAASAAAPEKEDAESEAFVFNIPRPTKVVIWSKFIMKNGHFMQRHVSNCTLERAFKHDALGNRSITIDEDYDISDADVVVFNLAPLEQHYVLPRHKPQGQLWVAGCWEPISFDGADIPGDCSLMNDTATMSLMDGVASYQNQSLFPAFFTPPTEAQLRRPAPDFGAAQGRELATYASSDCRVRWRDGWVSAVNRSLAAKGAPGVLSYGKCLQTAEEVECSGPDAVEQPTEADDTVEEWVFAKFANRCMSRPFALVAENSLSPWYITEKIWNALATGAIPVYLGPPEVKDLVPPDSVIFAGDYATPEALADALLSFDEGAFERARAWKGDSTARWGMWRRARLLSRATLLPRLCAAGASRPTVGGIVEELEAGDGGWSHMPPMVPLLQGSASVVSSESAEAAAPSLMMPDVQHALESGTEAAENRTTEETLDALDEAGDPTADVARSTVTRIDDFLRRSNHEQEEARAFLSRADTHAAVSKIAAGHALRQLRKRGVSKRGAIVDFSKDIEDLEGSLGVPTRQEPKARRH